MGKQSVHVDTTLDKQRLDWLEEVLDLYDDVRLDSMLPDCSVRLRSGMIVEGKGCTLRAAIDAAMEEFDG